MVAVVSEAAILFYLAMEGTWRYTKTFALTMRSVSENFSPVSGSTALMARPIMVPLSDPSHFIPRMHRREN